MKNLQAYKVQISSIKDLVDKLEKGNLTLSELLELEKLTREIHEKSIILKYKAFEEKTHSTIEDRDAEPIKVDEKEIIETIAVNNEEVPEEEIQELPSLDFSIFEDEEKETEIEPLQAMEEVVATTEIPDEETKEKSIKETPESDSSFFDRFNMEDDSINSKFNGSPIETLVGAFGLNQKLQYINELFDGSSETFSEAIKTLDSQQNLHAAKEKVDEIAVKNSWDPEEETVIEFIAILNRRYA